MEVTDREAFKQIVREVIQEMPYHRCPLEDIGITAEDHKSHHRLFAVIIRDFKVIKNAFLVGIATPTASGLLWLLWELIKAKTGG